MIVFANFLMGIGQVLDIFLQALIFLVVIRALISWVNPDPFNPIVHFLIETTDPFLTPLRKYVPLIGGKLDITPLVLLAALYFLRIFLVQTLYDYGGELKRPTKALPIVQLDHQAG